MMGQVMGKTGDLAGTEDLWDKCCTSLLGCGLTVITMMTSSVSTWWGKFSVLTCHDLYY